MWTAIKAFFSTTLYQPIYNLLVYLIDIIPGGEVGLAVIGVTAFVKILLLPLSIKSIRTQQTMKKVKPEIDRIKEEYDDDKEAQAAKMMEAYGEYDVNPFAGIFIILLQFPIIIALYHVFLDGGLPQIDVGLVYEFIPIPTSLDMSFLGTTLSERSVVLALVAGLSQLLQVWISNKFSLSSSGSDAGDKDEGSEEIGAKSFMEEFQENMSSKFMYVMPGIVFAISWSFPAVVAVYWATSNVFQLLQTIYVHKTIHVEEVDPENDPVQDSQ